MGWFKRAVAKHHSLINWVLDFPKCPSALSSYIFCTQWRPQRSEVEANLDVRHTSEVLLLCTKLGIQHQVLISHGSHWRQPRLFAPQTLPSLETFLMLSLKATTFEWLRKSASERLAILCSNCSFTLADRLNMASGCCEVTCGEKKKTFACFYQSQGPRVVSIGQLNIRAGDQMVPGRSDLCRDLLHDVNKVVNLPVQLGTVQKHGLQLFDGRVHIFICNTTTRQLTTRRGKCSSAHFEEWLLQEYDKNARSILWIHHQWKWVQMRINVLTCRFA